MNCNQGDLAVIVRGPAFEKYIGQVVRCVSPWPRLDLWRIDRSLDGSEAWVLVPDSCLRPIRYGEGEDEILSLVGKPTDALTP